MEKRIKNSIAKRHIWLINSNGKAKQYGVGYYIKNIVSILKKTNAIISVIDFSIEIEVPVVRKISGVYYFDLPFYPQSLERGKDKLYYYGVATFLLKYINVENVNIFHFNYIHQLCLNEILKKSLPTVHTIFTVHYLTWHFALDGNYSRFLKIITNKTVIDEKERIVKENYIYEKSQLCLVDNIICLSEETFDLLLKYYNMSYNSIFLIRNGQPKIKFNNLFASKKSIRKKFHVGQNEKIILFVGRLDKLKGIKYLLKAFQKIHDLYNDSRLWIVGDGDYNLCLSESGQLWKYITFTGRISQKDLFQLYQIADVGVIPSLCEQCSFVALEMLHFKIPIITTTAYGLKEIFKSNEQCMVKLIEKNDCVVFPVEELATKIVEVFEGKIGVFEGDILSEFSFSVMKNKMINLYFNC